MGSTAIEFSKTSFPKNNSGIVLIADTARDVAYHNSWQAISVEWFDKLIDKSDAASGGDTDNKLWWIRTSLFILINDQQIYNSLVLKKETIGSNNTDTRGGVSQIRELLQLYQGYQNINKEENRKYLSLVSREYVKNEMNSSAFQFHNL